MEEGPVVSEEAPVSLVSPLNQQGAQNHNSSPPLS